MKHSEYDNEIIMSVTCPSCGERIQIRGEEFFAAWAKFGGSKKTEKKSASSRENGKKGGRPPKRDTV